MFQNVLNGKAYIGRSNNLKHRYMEHMRLLRLGIEPCVKLRRAWEKYGEENFIYVILCYCDGSELNSMEKYYINIYDSFENGYNCTFGGDGILGYHHTDEAKEKIAAAGTGRKHTKEAIQKMCAAQKGRTFSDETIQKMRDAWTPERRIELSAKVSGSNCPFYGMTGAKNIRSVAVVASTGEQFTTMTEAAKWCGVKSGCVISSHIAGKSKTCGTHPITGERLTWRRATNDEIKALRA